jgi:sulfur carrier protein ThiS
MKINVHLINDDEHQKLTLPKQSKAVDTLKKLKIPPDTVIITRNKQPIPIDSILEPGDELTIIRVLSGG